MKALLYGPPTVQIRDRVHWRQWPGRAACGVGLSLAQQTPSPDRGVVSCESCQDQLRSWYRDTQLYIRVMLPGIARPLTPDMLGVESFGPFRSLDEARSCCTELRRKMLRWGKKFGSYPSIDVVLDYRHVPRSSFPTWPTHWGSQGDRTQGDRAQGDTQGDRTQGDTQGDRTQGDTQGDTALLEAAIHDLY